MALLILFSLLVVSFGVQLDIHVTVGKNVENRVTALSRLAPHNQIDFTHKSSAHVTLYLTDFQDQLTEEIIGVANKVIDMFGRTCIVKLVNFTVGGSPYVLWNVENNSCLQDLSNAVVLALYNFAKPNQPIPDWVNSLPAQVKAEKIEMIKRYGSPNVFSQFQPHVTIAYDTQDNVSKIYGSLRNETMSYTTEEVQISKVGPFGTVLKAGSIANITMNGGSLKNDKAFGDNSFDYFLLVREWPGTMSINPVPNYVDSFLLHGLWPNRLDGSYPSFCNSSYPFRYSEIASIITALDDAWYDSMNDQANATSFWSHEWDKHGTCSMVASCCFNEKAYFSAAINLHNTYAYVNWLAQQSIVPTDPDNQLYSKIAFLNALAQNYIEPPLIRCKYQNDYSTILDIAICLDKSLNPMKCPSNLRSQWEREEDCDDQIAFPTIPH